MNRNQLAPRTLEFLSQIDQGHAFPVGRCLQSLVETGHVPSDLRAINEDLASQMPGQRSGGGLFLPASALLTRADLATTSGSVGGHTVGARVEAAAEALRPLSSVLIAGGRLVDGLRGNAFLPVVGGVGALTWLAEGDPCPALSETFGSVSTTPRRAGGYLRISRQLFKQSPEVFEQAIMTDLRSAVAQTIDAAAIAGAGGTAPVGIFGTSGIGSFTFGGAATVAPFIAAEATLRTAGFNGPLVILGSPASIAKWRTNPRSATMTTVPLMTDENTVAGLPVLPSGNLPSNKVVVGSFGAVQVLVWGLEILSNPYSLALEGEILLVVNLLCNVRVSQAEAFVASSDTGAA